MKYWLYKKALAVFIFTIGIYILIWCTVSYIGVYVTYVVGPILVLSGLIAYWCAPKEGQPEDGPS
jgi:uncharacterized membrane protein HdeD (DUF308 family)